VIQVAERAKIPAGRQDIGRPVSLQELWSALRRHPKKMVACFLAVLGAASAWVVCAPRTYVSQAKLYLRMGRENVTLDASATTGPTVQLYQTVDNQVTSALQVLDSRTIAEQVVDAIGVHHILAGTRPTKPGEDELAPQAKPAGRPWTRLLETLSSLDPESDRSRAIRKLQEQMSIGASLGSTVLNIECRAGDPHLAQMIVETWTQTFLRERLQLTATRGSQEFFDREVEEIGRQLAAKERELRDARNDAGLVSTAGQKKILEDQIGSVRLRLAANQAATASTQAKIKELLSQATHQSQHQAVLTEQTALAGLQAERRALDAELRANQVELRTLNQQTVRIEDLERQVGILDARYRTQAERSEQARVNGALARDGVSSVSILQPPSFVEKPLSPNKTLVVCVGLLAAVGLALAAALVSEYRDRTLRSAEQIERTLSMSVFAAIPKLSRRELRSALPLHHAHHS